MSDINSIGIGNMLSCFGGTQVLVGPQGPEGPQGDTGPQGLQGIQGPVGAQGPIGLQGPQGPQGPQGLAGTNGTNGTNGIDGATGPQGIQGIQGEQGVQGIQGIQGPQGPAGLQGDTGPGVCTGGYTGQVLSKISDNNYETDWITVPTTEQFLEATGYGIISGGQVTAKITPDMTVAVSASIGHMPSGERVVVPDVPTMQIEAASTSSNRLDLLYMNKNSNIRCVTGEPIAAAIAGRCTYTITTNAVVGDIVTVYGIPFTCVTSGATSSQFNIGADVNATATNLRTALAANTTINSIFTATVSDATITLTETVPGGGNTPYSPVYSGTIVVTSTLLDVSTPAVTEVLLPPLPTGCLPIAQVAVAMSATSITDANITDLRVFKKLHKIQAFSVAIDVTTGTTTATKVVVFPNGTFENTPVVTASITTDTIGNPAIAVVKVIAKSTTGITLKFDSVTNATATGVVNVDIIATDTDA